MISDDALARLRSLMASLPTEDGRHHVNDMVIWAVEHGRELLEELDAARSPDVPASLSPPADFSVHVIAVAHVPPDPASTVVVLDVDALGGLPAVSSWLRAFSHPCVYLSLSKAGGDMTKVPDEYAGVLCGPAWPGTHAEWRRQAWLLWGASRGLIPEDPAVEGSGGVSLEEFEDHLAAGSSGEWDDGTTC